MSIEGYRGAFRISPHLARCDRLGVSSISIVSFMPQWAGVPEVNTPHFHVSLVSLLISVSGAAAACPACPAPSRMLAHAQCAADCQHPAAPSGSTLNPVMLRTAFAKIAAINPRVATGQQCFASNLTAAQLERLMATYNALPPGQFLPGNAVPQFNMGSVVWTGNGLQGGGITARKAILTYSFPDDGVAWGSSPQSPNQLSADFANLFGAANVDKGRELIRQSLTNWRRNAGLVYSEVVDSNIALDNITTRRSSLGDFRIGGIQQGLESGILAYNFYPSSGGDMTFNSDYFPAGAGGFSDSSNTYRYLRNTASHEHGHGLGLAHQVPCLGTKLMEPFANDGFEMVALDDRRGGQRAYGDRFAGNTLAATAKDFGNLSSPAVRSVIEKELSTNGAYTPSNLSGADWFRFTLTTAQSVTFTVTPTGLTYPAADQAGGCDPTVDPVPLVNALSAGNLAVALYDTTGINLIRLADLNLNGGIETLAAGTLAPGNYTVRVFDVGPNNITNQFVQTYDLTVRVGASKAPPAAFAGVHKRVPANVNCFFYANLNSYANEGTINATTGYRWDFNNDGVFEIVNPQPVRVYVTNGTFAATLRVVDSNGMSADDTISVVVTGATSEITSVSVGTALQGTTVPITITGKNFRGITAAGVTLGGGVSITGTPVTDYLGTTITGLSMVTASNAAGGLRDVSVSTTDGLATIGGAISVLTCPTVLAGPDSISLAEASPLTLTATVAGTAAQSYQWLFNGSPVTAPSATGTTTTTLRIPSVAISNSGNYSLRVTGPCATVTSPVAAVMVTPVVTACGTADIVGGGGLPPGDGIIDGSDFIAFINAFASDDPMADVASSGIPGPDGIVDGSDFIAFINSFAQGC